MNPLLLILASHCNPIHAYAEVSPFELSGTYLHGTVHSQRAAVGFLLGHSFSGEGHGMPGVGGTKGKSGQSNGCDCLQYSHTKARAFSTNRTFYMPSHTSLPPDQQEAFLHFKYILYLSRNTKRKCGGSEGYGGGAESQGPLERSGGPHPAPRA